MEKREYYKIRDEFDIQRVEIAMSDGKKIIGKYGIATPDFCMTYPDGRLLTIDIDDNFISKIVSINKTDKGYKETDRYEVE